MNVQKSIQMKIERSNHRNFYFGQYFVYEAELALAAVWAGCRKLNESFQLNHYALNPAMLVTINDK